MTPPPTGRHPPAKLVPAPRNKRDVKFVAKFDNGHDLFRGGGKHHHVRRFLINDESIAFIDQNLIGFEEH